MRVLGANGDATKRTVTSSGTRAKSALESGHVRTSACFSLVSCGDIFWILPEPIPYLLSFVGQRTFAKLGGVPKCWISCDRRRYSSAHAATPATRWFVPRFQTRQAAKLLASTVVDRWQAARVHSC